MYCVESNYQILVITDKPAIVKIFVGGREYNDAFGGIYPSDKLYHRITVPMEELDLARAYTVSATEMLNRRPYFPILGEHIERTWRFDPVPTDRPIRAYAISDVHTKVENTVAAQKAFGDTPDLLLFIGDVAHDIDSLDAIMFLPEVISRLTHGSKPVVFTRGNHDARGVIASSFGEYMGTDNGNPFFTFRLGGIWGVILDCGEDKADDHEEYNGTICMSPFRRAQTEMLHRLLETKPYEAPGIKHRICLCHVPFTHSLGEPPFDIEKDTYREWTRCLGEMHIDALLCGHEHNAAVIMPGNPDEDLYGQRFPTLILTTIFRSESGERCARHAGMIFDDDRISLRFTDSLGGSSEEIEL